MVLPGVLTALERCRQAGDRVDTVLLWVEKWSGAGAFSQPQGLRTSSGGTEVPGSEAFKHKLNQYPSQEYAFSL